MEYYSDRLNADRLRRCYEIAPPRITQYLEAEIAHVLARIPDGARVLELGCGYGRVLGELLKRASGVFGIDTSLASLQLAKAALDQHARCRLLQMNAASLGFRDHCFDAVVCIQNGISAFHIDRRALIREAVRVTRLGGCALFSSYADSFWDERLHWFQLQAEAGLVGEFDSAQTRPGTIACKDVFTATTVNASEFASLAVSLGLHATVSEVDQSSVFCEISV